MKIIEYSIYSIKFCFIDRKIKLCLVWQTPITETTFIGHNLRNIAISLRQNFSFCTPVTGNNYLVIFSLLFRKDSTDFRNTLTKV